MATMSVFAACQKIKNLANINVDIPYSTQVSVPKVDGTVGVPIPGGSVIDFPTVGIEPNSKAILAQYHTSQSKIVSVDLKSLSMQVITPPDLNFDFLDTVQIYISANSLPEMMVAYKYGIPKGSNTLDFITVTSVNLKGYFLADTLYLRMRAHINTVPASGAQLSIASKFHLVANPLD